MINGAASEVWDRGRFDADVREFTGWYLQQNPVRATELGVHTHDHELSDASSAGLRTQQAGLEVFLERLARYAPEQDSDWLIDLRLMEGFARARLRALIATDLPHRSPDFYGAEALFGPYSLLLREFAPLEERLRALTGRLAAVPRLLADAEQNLDRCPALWVDIALETGEGGLALFQQLIPALAAEVRTGDPVLAARLEAANNKAVTAILRYLRFLRETLRPRAGGTFAAGEATWNAIVREEHMLDLDAAAITAIGWDLIRETEAALEEEAAAIASREGGPARSWQRLLAEVRADHPAAAEVVPAYAEAMEASRAFVIAHDLVTLPPDEHLHIAETPPFVRPLFPYAAYLMPGPFEPRQLGIFWVTPVPPGLPPAETEALLRGHPRAKIPGIAVHEGYPGHHLQLTRANRAAGLPRKLGHDLANLLVEGWAFYCEEMMEQEGFLIHPRGRLARLADQLWRACRVVIDPGLHTGALSFDAAVALLTDVAGLELPAARAEVQRYSQSPTQPMSYLIGKREIGRIAAEYRARQAAAGEPFALKTFHDALLDCGSLPPRLLRLALFGS